LSAPDYSDFHLKFTLDSLKNLEENLQKLSIPLVYLESNLPNGFEQLSKKYEIISIFSHQET
jgi:deoxyribodipyrimidine photo-lyase